MFQASLYIDISGFRGKLFKHVAASIRTGIINEHGFSAIKGITDVTLREAPITIRFRTLGNRKNFRRGLMSVLHPDITSKMSINRKPVVIKPMVPKHWVTNPVKINSSIRSN